MEFTDKDHALLDAFTRELTSLYPVPYTGSQRDPEARPWAAQRLGSLSFTYSDLPKPRPTTRRRKTS